MTERTREAISAIIKAYDVRGVVGGGQREVFASHHARCGFRHFFVDMAGRLLHGLHEGHEVFIIGVIFGVKADGSRVCGL